MIFFSFVKNKHVTAKKYLASINVWNTFKMNAMGDYYDLYMKTDVLLLANFFEKFINKC